MRQVTVSELHDYTQPYLDVVEQGEILHILKEGKHIADLVPAKMLSAHIKKAIVPLALENISLSEEVIKDRSESR